MTRQEPPDEAKSGDSQREGAANNPYTTGAPAQPDEADAASLAQAFAALADEPTLSGVGVGQAVQATRATQAPEPLWPTESAEPNGTVAPSAPTENYPDLEATPRQQDARAVAPWLFSSAPASHDSLDATTQPAEFAPTEKAPTIAASALPPMQQTPDISEQSTARLPQPLPEPTSTPSTAQQAPTAEPKQIVPPAVYRSAGPIEQPEEPSEASTNEWPDLSTPLIAVPPLPAPPLATPATPPTVTPRQPDILPRTTAAPAPEQRPTPRYATPDAYAQAQPYAPPRPPLPRPTAPPQQPAIRRAPQQSRPVAPSAPVEPFAPFAPSAPPTRPAPFPTLPPTKRRGGFSVGGLMILVVVLAFLGVAGYGVYTTTQAERPYATAQVFCADLRSQSYTSAYALLSSRYQEALSQRLFVLANQLHDQLNGLITSCSVASPSSVAFTYRTPTSATIPALIVRNQQLRGALTLIQQGGVWRVDQIASTLEGIDVDPLLTQAKFCDAVMAGNYALAYEQLATGAQAPGSEQDFALSYAHAFSGANGGLKLTQCQPDLTSYKVGETYGKVNVTFVTLGAGQTVNFPTLFTFALQNGAWKIASLTTSVTPTA